MITKTCDRCGSKINTDPRVNAILPMFSIRKIEGLTIGWQSVDLCPKCEKMLAEWLNGNRAIATVEENAYSRECTEDADEKR